MFVKRLKPMQYLLTEAEYKALIQTRDTRAAGVLYSRRSDTPVSLWCVRRNCKHQQMQGHRHGAVA